jgi:hypothetical protein
MNRTPEIVDAIKAIDPTAWVSCTSNDITKIRWADNNPNNITYEQIKTKLIELQAASDAQAYARSRKEEYDKLNQNEMMYDDEINSTTTWKDAIAAIKTKYPKPE